MWKPNWKTVRQAHYAAGDELHASQGRMPKPSLK